MVAGPFDSEISAKTFVAYYLTKFFRFMVSLRKITQDAAKSTYLWVPRNSIGESPTDSELYEKYGLEQGHIDYIESIIRPMEPEDA